MKLTLYHRTEILRALIYRRLIHRTEPNRPHISSDISISNSVETKRNQMRPNFLARLACSVSVFSLAPRCRLARLAPRWCIAAPPVRGVLRLVAHTRNPFFQEKCKIMICTAKHLKPRLLAQTSVHLRKWLKSRDLKGITVIFAHCLPRSVYLYMLAAIHRPFAEEVPTPLVHRTAKANRRKTPPTRVSYRAQWPIPILHAPHTRFTTSRLSHIVRKLHLLS